MNQWQDITTAPKDGTEVDLWTAFGRVTGAKFVDGKWVEWFDRDGEWIAVDQPSHWMPCPEPPRGVA